jgi:hypothetical protein
MAPQRALIALTLCGAIAAGCGDDDDDAEQAVAPEAPTLAQRQAELDTNPYDLRCADIRDKVDSARMTRIVQYALADDAKIPELTRLQSGQSIFYAITELCDGQPDSDQPAREAVAGVRSGEYRVDLETP